MAQIWKLTTGKVVAVEGGVTRVLTPPTGVHYDFPRRRWVATVVDSKGEWAQAYFPIKTVGAQTALEQASLARELSLNFLLHRRLLPRVRKGYTPRVVNDLYVVWDPVSHTRRFFTDEKHAKAFNDGCVKEWLDLYKYDRDTMVEIRTQLKLDFAEVKAGVLEPLLGAQA